MQVGRVGIPVYPVYSYIYHRTETVKLFFIFSVKAKKDTGSTINHTDQTGTLNKYPVLGQNDRGDRPCSVFSKTRVALGTKVKAIWTG